MSMRRCRKLKYRAIGLRIVVKGRLEYKKSDDQPTAKYSYVVRNVETYGIHDYYGFNQSKRIFSGNTTMPSKISFV